MSRVGILLLMLTKVSALTLPETYDSSTRPNQGGVADVVNVSVELLAIRDLNEARSEMTVDISLHTSWVDSRLLEAVKKETLIVNQSPNIWLPDVQVANAHLTTGNSKDSITNQFLQINKDGLVRLSRKQTVKISCQISLAKYPFDRQLCKVHINSYGYSAVHLKLFWHGTVSEHVPMYHPEFSFSFAEQTSANVKTPEGADYSNLYLEIAVTRCPLRVIFRALLPSLMLLALSYYLTFCHCPILRNKKSNMNGNHVEATVIAQPEPPPTLSCVPGFNLLLIALNGMIFLLTVILAQLNFLVSPSSSSVSGLDVWLNFITTVIFVILWHSVQLYFNSAYRRIHMKTDNDSCYVNDISTIFKLGIPPLVIVFLIVFFGVYLS